MRVHSGSAPPRALLVADRTALHIASHRTSHSAEARLIAYVKRSLYLEGMATTQARIISSAERVFDTRGFAASGMDELTAAAGVSTRTLYKHLGSKTGLMLAVLEARTSRFFDRCEVDTVDGLFACLEEWVESEGSRGCLFLRAQGEAGTSTPETAEAVARYRARLRALISRIVDDDALATQILVLFEGATSTASYLGPDAVTSARTAATALLDAAEPTP